MTPELLARARRSFAERLSRGYRRLPEIREHLGDDYATIWQMRSEGVNRPAPSRSMNLSEADGAPLIAGLFFSSTAAASTSETDITDSGKDRGVGRFVCTGSQTGSRGGGNLASQYRKALGGRSHVKDDDVGHTALLLVVVNASAAMSGRFFFCCCQQSRNPPAPEKMILSEPSRRPQAPHRRRCRYSWIVIPSGSCSRSRSDRRSHDSQNTTTLNWSCEKSGR